MTHATPPHLPPLPARPAIHQRLPRATPPVLQIGDTVIIGGVPYTVTATPTLTPSAAPPPPPPPRPPPPNPYTFLQYRSDNGTITTQTRPFMALEIDGSGFGAATGLVTLGGVPATVQQWSDAKIIVMTPNLPSGPVIVAVNGVPAPLPLTNVLPPPPPPPPPFFVTGFRDANRNPINLNAQGLYPVIGGTSVYLEGSGFGATPGTVTSGLTPLVIEGWTDTQIEVIAPPYVAVPAPPVPPLTNGGVGVIVKRADGLSGAASFWLVLPPLPAQRK